MWITCGDTTYNTDALAYVRRAQRDGEVTIVVCPTNSPARQFSEDEAACLMDYLAVETELVRQRVAYLTEQEEISDLKLAELINDFQDRMEVKD